jgi:hypothetical protein
MKTVNRDIQSAEQTFPAEALSRIGEGQLSHEGI